MLNVLENSVEVMDDDPNEVSPYTLFIPTYSITSHQELIDVFNRILNESHQAGWTQLQTVSSGSQTLLQNTERYASYLASTLNNTNESLVLTRENVGKILYTSERPLYCKRGKIIFLK